MVVAKICKTYKEKYPLVQIVLHTATADAVYEMMNKGLGKIGYVANSPYTVKGESMSAGRLYDKIGDKAKGKVVFVVDGGVVCRIIN